LPRLLHFDCSLHFVLKCGHGFIGLAFDAKPEYMTEKGVIERGMGCQVCIIENGDVNDKGKY
jgi:hypothetical protein